VFEKRKKKGIRFDLPEYMQERRICLLESEGI